MSRGLSYERSVRQPAILCRKRKAEKDLVISPEYSSPSSSDMTTSDCEDSPSTDFDVSCDENQSPNHKLSSAALTKFRGIANIMQPFSDTCSRASPLPELDWAEQKELWHSMVLKDILYTRDCKVLLKHPDLEPRMRAILLDWLTEVSEVYKLRRETFYLALDYIDRFLQAKPNLPRNCLQLLGVTAIFVASKMEEIYPPKLDQFAFVTDGACTESQILQQELILIMTLNWNLTPITINCWLNIFLQLAYLEDNSENLIGPEKFPKNLFMQISQVLDLCILDVESLKYSYSVLAASAIAHFISKETAMHVSGLSWTELHPCVTWLKPYMETAHENKTDMKYFSDISTDDYHNIQTHSACLRLLDKVIEKQRAAVIENSPSLVLRELTPPQSHKKKQIKLEP